MTEPLDEARRHAGLLSQSLELEWRPMRDEDRNYVLSSWLRSYAEASEFRHVARGVYFAIYEPVVKQLMERATIAIAWTKDLPDSVLGWLAVEGDDVVHYVLVKPRWRKLGIGRWMTRELATMPAVYTHAPTLAGSRLVGDAWTYEPMRRFEKKAA